MFVSLLMLIRIFQQNNIAEIRLKFSNVNKTENQASLRQAPKLANEIETYKIYEIETEKLSPKLAIYEWINRLQKKFPKGSEFLLRHKEYNKPTTTKVISLQLTKLLRELKILGASAYSMLHSAITELAKLNIPERVLANFTHHYQNSCTVQQYYIFASSTRANDIVKQYTSISGQNNERLNQVLPQRGEKKAEKWVTNYYLRFHQGLDNDLLSSYLLISSLARPKYISQLEVRYKQGENSLENQMIEQTE
ncbi:MAG: hypothetical protein EZS28_027650 [Streblomastix strix]|uniref:Tyr recombinase domain-containing protein n=1 Tax=Streblomastix strix TaxID=222440 RepID=A0A5J4V2U2_9EUKA|nr:MAG: hypothetical protein EZS28_027650 [Streblomastix strix]